MEDAAMQAQEAQAKVEYSIFDEKGSIRPVPAGVDHFAFFGLPRRFGLDEAALEAKFYELSRRLHPDFFQGAPVAERIRSLDASARLNAAYQTLKDPLRRTVYLVELESGPLAENDSRPPAAMMEDILEAQEAAAELRCCEGEEEAGALLRRIQAARDCFEALRKGRSEALAELGRKWDAAREAGGEAPGEVLEKMRATLGLRNYIENTLRSLREALEAAR